MLEALRASRCTYRSEPIDRRLIVGAVLTPEALRQLPVQALVIPALNVLKGSAFGLTRKLLLGAALKTLLGRRGSVLIREDGNNPAFLMMRNFDGNLVGRALSTLANYDRVAFAPFAKGKDRAAEILIGGLLAFHRSGTASPRPSEILIPFENEADLSLFFDHLESHRDPYRETVSSYLDQRSRPSSHQPLLIPPYTDSYASPLHVGEKGVRPPEQAGLLTPFRGYVRLFSDALLDRAISLVPSHIRSAGEGLPPPFTYARLIGRPVRSKDFIDPQGGRDSLESINPIRRTTSIMEYSQTGAPYAVNEIGLFDLARRSLDHSDRLGEMIISTQYPRGLADHIYDISGYEVVPADLLERVRAQARLMELPFSTAELDRMLVHKVLHECAEALWWVLPESIHNRWMDLFPVDQPHETSGVYFRNLLRIHSEGPVEDPKEFFASETFADVMALYWMDEIPEVHRILNGGLVSRYRSFFEEVMGWARGRRDRYGTVFYVEKV